MLFTKKISLKITNLQYLHVSVSVIHLQLVPTYIDYYFGDNFCGRKCHTYGQILVETSTFLPAKSDSDIMFYLQSYQRLIIDRSLVH